MPADRGANRGAFAGLVFASLILQACASVPSGGKLDQFPPLPEPAQPPVVTAKPLRFSDLPGWNGEDHAAALDAYRATCGVSRDPVMMDICAEARDLGRQDELVSRAFLEANFRPVPVGETGLLTAYFAPRYEAREAPDAVFSEPVRGRPSDLVVVDLTKVPVAENPGEPVHIDLATTAVPAQSASGVATLDLSLWNPAPIGARVTGRVTRGALTPYPDRAAIEKTAPETVLAWMKPEDLFFLQIQGSGVLVFPDGHTMRASYAVGNGRRFAGIAAPMRDRGLLADDNTSGGRIHDWLAEHRGPAADAVMALNPSYVFFNLQPNDGQEASGAAGVPLPAGRALAIDSSQHRYGEVYWISATAPALSGAFPVYRRLAVALDTGGAITGLVRADLYMGTGDAAGAEAGRVRHQLRLYQLVPVAELAGARRPTPTPTPTLAAWGQMAPIP